MKQEVKLKNSFARLNYAHEKFQKFIEFGSIFFQSKPFDYFCELDEKDNYIYLKLKTIKPLPLNFALIVSDILHHLRSALDNAVYDLSENIKNETDPQFPIFYTEEKFNEKKKYIKYLKNEYQQIIKTYQPFEYEKKKIVSYIEILNLLNNKDKHRLLNIVLIEQDGHSIILNGISRDKYEYNENLSTNNDWLIKWKKDFNNEILENLRCEPTVTLSIKDDKISAIFSKANINQTVFGFSDFRTLFSIIKNILDELEQKYHEITQPPQQ